MCPPDIVAQVLRALAAFPETLSADAQGGPSLFDELPEKRTCQQAGIPDVYCACRHGFGS